ncbi:MAG: ornithine carbamoyltransferase, partial [Elusimicrobiota bacterium]
EHKKKLKGLTVTWVGDGNNVLNSWIEAAPMLGINLRMAVPKGYEPDKEILKYGVDLARKEGTEMLLTNDPVEGVKKSDVIYSDVWVSMGQDAEKEKKLRDFRDFQINETLVKHANRDYLFMHCLPAHRGEEVSAGVIDGPNSIVFDEAENRLHAQKAILVMHLLRGKKINV